MTRAMKEKNNDSIKLEDYFLNMDLNDDLRQIYEIINDDDLNLQYKKEKRLFNLRNQNYKNYCDINLEKYIDLPESLNKNLEDIKAFYNEMNSKQLLIEDETKALQHKRNIRKIFNLIEKLDDQIRENLQILEKSNNSDQSKISISYFDSLNLDEKLKSDVLNLYNQVIMCSPEMGKSNIECLKLEIKRRELLDQIFKLLDINSSSTSSSDNEKLLALNDKLSLLIENYKNNLEYLDGLMIQNSKYFEEYENFKTFFLNQFMYNKNDYKECKKTYEILSDDFKFKLIANNYKELFIKERNEKTFILEKLGIKNISKSLDYISANYIEILNDSDKSTIENIYKLISTENYDIKAIRLKLESIVRKIWNKTMTDFPNEMSGDDFYFLCSNNQFLEPKYETILLTNRIIERMEDYRDYQIGFICNYNKNILYITDSDDIMSVDDSDMSSLKTPLQIEQEYINFNVLNKVVLNGLCTKIVAVYFIDDGDYAKHAKALELANNYNLPLVNIKKIK